MIAFRKRFNIVTSDFQARLALVMGLIFIFRDATQCGAVVRLSLSQLIGQGCGANRPPAKMSWLFPLLNPRQMVRYSYLNSIFSIIWDICH